MASYPKSGNTWTRALITCFVRDAPITSAGDIGETVPDIIRVLRCGTLLRLDGPGPHVVKTHFLPDREIMRLYERETRKIVHIVRNPRDVILSAARHLNVVEDKRREFALDFIENGGVRTWMREGIGTWAESVLAWSSEENVRAYYPDATVLTVRYEDMRADTFACLRTIVEFLDLGPADDDRVKRAVENSSPDRMRAAERKDFGRGIAAFREPPRNLFVGSGLTNQPLAGLGDDVEAAYVRALNEREDVHRAAERFGYTG